MVYCYVYAHRIVELVDLSAILEMISTMSGPTLERLREPLKYRREMRRI